MTREQYEALNDDEKAELTNRLMAENAALKANANNLNAVRCQVSPKGAVSVYGFGKWPVTLYGSQWDKLFAQRETIEGFIEANRSALSVKA